MIAALFDFGYWLALFIAACGAVVYLAFIWLCVAEWLENRRKREALAHMYAMARPLRPFDQEDPLESAFALPCAPDPRRLA